MDNADLEAMVRHTYEAFNARDIEAAVALMADDVDWPNMLDGKRVIGKGEVRAYWIRQFGEFEPRVEPLSVRDSGDGEVVVEVHQLVRNFDGAVVSEEVVHHVYRFEDGQIVRMDVEAVR